MWGSVLPVHSLIALGLGPGLRLASDGCTKGETQGCGPGISPVAAGVPFTSLSASGCCWHEELWDLLF